MTDTPPPLYLIRRLLVRTPEVTDDPKTIAGADQQAAYYRGLFAAFGIHPKPGNVFVQIVTLEIARHAVTVAAQNRSITDTEHAAADAVLRSLIFAIADTAPDEVQR